LPQRSSPQPELTPYLDAIGNALAAIASDRDVDTHEVALPKALDAALQAAVGLAKRKRGVSWTSLFESSYTAIIAENLRNLRLEAGWTQQQLANAMTAIGFGWARETAVEVERYGRKLQLEEVLGIAALFSVPVVELLLPDEETALDMPKAHLEREQLRELMVGRGGRIGEGGADWVAGIYALGGGRTVERPAVDLWQNRKAKSGGPTRTGRRREERS
jgi:transcriptional regulator with XRE-family HTH domain